MQILSRVYICFTCVRNTALHEIIITHEINFKDKYFIFDPLTVKTDTFFYIGYSSPVVTVTCDANIILLARKVSMGVQLYNQLSLKHKLPI